jgi:hypothetical protein
MSKKTAGALAGIVLAGIVLGGAMLPVVTASAAHAADQEAAGPVPHEDQIPSRVSCRSPAAWLRLTSLTVSFPSGRAQAATTCYTGDGTKTVAVPQVEQAAVSAGHAACLVLYQNGWVHRACIAGGTSRTLELPTVIRVQLSTPASPPRT